MKKKLLKFSCLCIAIISLLSGCNKKEEVGPSPQELIIYGTVIDRETGYPLHNVQVTFLYATEITEGAVGSAVTGSDGSYEFVFSSIINNAEYGVELIKYGYSQYLMEISLAQYHLGDRVRMDFQLVRE